MHLDNPDSSLDMIYCNSLDHAFDIESFFSAHARVIKPDGYVLYDIGLPKDGASTTGAFEAVKWKSEEVLFLLMLKYFRKVVKVETERRWRWMLLRGKNST